MESKQSVYVTLASWFGYLAKCKNEKADGLAKSPKWNRLETREALARNGCWRYGQALGNGGYCEASR
jgi:hypothetical protein